MSTVTAKNELHRCLTWALKTGVAQEQMSRFLHAGYVPQPKQLEFHAAARECDEENGPAWVGYGGTRGQAKSHAVLAQTALDDCQRQPGLKVLYLRKIQKAAGEQLEDLVHKLLNQVPHSFIPTRGILKFPNRSRIIIGGFKSENEIDYYLGIEYDVIIIEDATTLTESKFRQILGSLRTSKPDWRPRLYATANPGGVGHAWYRQTFVDPWWQKSEDKTRFIHTVMGDNVFVDSSYVDYLNSLTGWLRRAWRDGDFTIAAGQFFISFDPRVHVIEPIEITDDWMLWAAMDYGFVHWLVVYLLGKDADGNFYVIDEHAERRWLVPQHVEAIKAMLVRNEVTHLSTFVASPDAFAKRGATKTIAEEYSECGIQLVSAQTDRISGAARVLSLLGNVDQDIPPRLFIFNRCQRLIKCLPEMQHDPNRLEDVLKVDINTETGEGGDDPYDALRYGLMVEFAAPPAAGKIHSTPKDMFTPERKSSLW